MAKSCTYGGVLLGAGNADRAAMRLFGGVERVQKTRRSASENAATGLRQHEVLVLVLLVIVGTRVDPGTQAPNQRNAGGEILLVASHHSGGLFQRERSARGWRNPGEKGVLTGSQVSLRPWHCSQRTDEAEAKRQSTPGGASEGSSNSLTAVRMQCMQGKSAARRGAMREGAGILAAANSRRTAGEKGRWVLMRF